MGASCLPLLRSVLTVSWLEPSNWGRTEVFARVAQKARTGLRLLRNGEPLSTYGNPLPNTPLGALLNGQGDLCAAFKGANNANAGSVRSKTLAWRVRRLRG